MWGSANRSKWQKISLNLRGNTLALLDWNTVQREILVSEDRDWTKDWKRFLGKNSALMGRWMHVCELKYHEQRHRISHELLTSTWPSREAAALTLPIINLL